MSLQLPVLLASGLAQVQRVVVGPNAQLVVTAAVEKRCEIDRERHVAALVAAGQSVVEPYRRLVVDRLEVQDQPLPWRERWWLEASAVPAGGEEATASDPASRRLRRERNIDVPIPDHL